MCRGGGNLLYFLCLISNTLPQLEQSSLHPSTVLHHRHLLRTTCYGPPPTDHLLQSSPTPTSSHLQKRSQVEKPEGPSALQPTTESNTQIKSDKIGMGIYIYLVTYIV